MSGTLTLTFDPGDGQKRLQMVLPLDERTARNFARIRPLRDELPGLVSMETVVEVLRLKEFRKHLFVGEATRLGRLLAERMEDAEGWHDYSRIEPARRELTGPGDSNAR